LDTKNTEKSGEHGEKQKNRFLKAFQNALVLMLLSVFSVFSVVQSFML